MATLMQAPCDWDQESFCWICPDEGEHTPASHRRLVSAIGEDPIVQMVCCRHSMQEVTDADTQSAQPST